jgi:enoyl-CoA hydratase
MLESLLIENDGPVRILTLNRPERLNALDDPLRRAIAATIATAEQDDSVRALLLTGAGERAFCAGEDLAEGTELGGEETERWKDSWAVYVGALKACAKPLVIAVNGVAAGGGFVTTLFGDVRLAVPEARFIMAEIDIGLPAMLGGHLLAHEASLSLAAGIVLTGRPVSADEALRQGIIHEVATAGTLRARALARAHELAAKPPIAMRLNIKRLRQIRTQLMEQAGLAQAFDRAHGEALATGEPQRLMAAFLASRAARKKAKQG